MTDKEKLIELLEFCRTIEGHGMDLIEKYAAYLLAHGVTVREQGEWINQSFTLNGGKVHLYVCSKCGCEKGYEENFCPDCGAPMKGESK